MKKIKTLCAMALAIAANGAQAKPHTVDVMVLYTKGATAHENGRDIDARIASYVEHTNTMFAKSGVDMRIRLVHRQLLDWADYVYVEDKTLTEFTKDSKVRRLREQYGADIVKLLNTKNGDSCGLAWMANSQIKNSNVFTPDSKEMAYGLTGIGCSVGTFPHELGHNFGLRHSYEQDLDGKYYTSPWNEGTHEWSRGYGVRNKFATIMAYPQSFQTRNWAPLFSNPQMRDKDCAGEACGKPDGADAVRALNTMASQIANFRPTKVPLTANPGTGTGTPPPPPAELPWCSKPALNSVLSNGEFRTADSWRALFGQAELSLVNVALNCRDNALQMQAQSFDVLATPVTGLTAGTQYSLKAKTMLKARDSRENVRLAIIQEDINGSFTYKLEQAVSASVTGNEFSPLEKTFTYKTASNVRNLYVAVWSESGASLLIDEVELQAIKTATPPVAPAATKFGWDFEDGIGGWSSLHGKLRASSFASASRGALEVHSRAHEGSGASVSLLGSVEPGNRYRIMADMTIGRAASVSAIAYAFLYIEDSTGRGQYQSLGRHDTRGGTWSKLNREVQIPAGNLRRAELLIVGTQREQSLFIDNIVFNKL